jgi:putative serine protease PepD
MHPWGRLDQPLVEPAPDEVAPKKVAEVRPPPRAPRRRLIAAAVMLAVALLGFLSFRWGAATSASPLPTATPRPTATKPPTTAEIYAALAPSVVTIEALNASTQAVEATGTGVVANAQGVIVTALHVVKTAGAIRIRFADGTASPATVLAADPTIDIATLQPAQLPTVLVPAVLGNSGRLAVGDDVVAIGNQLGLTSSATAGVVSGLDRSAIGNDGTTLHGLIQFDAAVNPGSSGGPLVNGRGEMVGVVVALANPTAAGTFIGIGFAVPIGSAVGAGGGGRGPQQ